jgi:tRNA-modifying protein YgfZ
MAVFTLSGRSILNVSGPEAAPFLHNLLTTDIEDLQRGEIRPGALLTPQGKILFDFLVSRNGDGFRLECRSDTAADFTKRLKFYRLRAKVDIALEEQALVAIRFGNDSSGSESDSGSAWLLDRRFADKTEVQRGYGIGSGAADESHAYEKLRIAHGIAEGGFDYEFGDAFPHDVNLDQELGVSFSKGCYVGQEVVSRMQHRGTARRRILIARSAETLLAHTALTAGGRPIGTVGSSIGSEALALVRIDKAKDAMDAGTPILAGNVPVKLELPPNVNFNWPSADEAAE